MTYIPSKSEVEKFVADKLEDVKGFVRRHYGMTFKNDFSYSVHFRETKTAYATAKMPSQNQYRIVFGLHNLVTYPVAAYTEYKRLSTLKGIHSFATTDWKEWLTALICHEFAHIVTFAIPRMNSDFQLTKIGSKVYVSGYGEYETDHGHLFRAVYKTIRENYIPDVKYTNATRNFPDAPTIIQVQKVIKDGDFFNKGKKVKISGKIYEVIAYLPRANKFKWHVRQVSGTHIYKITDLQLEKYAV